MICKSSLCKSYFFTSFNCFERGLCVLSIAFHSFRVTSLTFRAVPTCQSSGAQWAELLLAAQVEACTHSVFVYAVTASRPRGDARTQASACVHKVNELWQKNLRKTQCKCKRDWALSFKDTISSHSYGLWFFVFWKKCKNEITRGWNCKRIRK